MNSYQKRIWELDMLKGLALLFMIYFHIIYDLDVIFGYPIDSTSVMQAATAKIAGSLFIFAAGISSCLTKNYLKRFLRLGAMAFGITLATFFAVPEMVITFGIIHLLAACVILGFPFTRLPTCLSLLCGIALIAASPWLLSLEAPASLPTFVLGLSPNWAVSSDYYPLLPWFGIYLCGTAAGKGLYRRPGSLFKYQPPDNPLLLAGRHTLLVYLVHQPLIIGALHLLSRF